MRLVFEHFGVSMSLDDQFTDAQALVKTLTSRPSNEALLSLYALFKQATAGDVSGKKPGMFDLKGRAKYEAWSGKSGLSNDQAKDEYIALVGTLTA
ncbi:MAG: acyl-CoA-binding protein [Myxococcota bacterium]|jgi:acyl-CoA-binding protein